MVGIIFNPMAGGGGAKQNWPLLERELRTLFPRMEIFPTQGKGHGVVLTKTALEQGHDWIVAVGGDGTLNEVVTGIMESKAPSRFSFVMVGRGNDFRRNFGNRPSWQNDLEKIKSGTVKKIDVGKVQYQDFQGETRTRFFLNYCGTGISADINKRMEKGGLLEQWGLKGKISYILSTLPALVTFGNPQVSWRVEGTPGKNLQLQGEEKIKLIMIGNGGYMAGGMPLLPGADPGDGLFNMMVVGDLKWARSLWEFPKVLVGKHLHLPGVFNVSGTKFQLSPGPRENKEVLVDLDGELVGRLPAKVEVLPGALSLFR